jgi:hypothetical protein
MSGRRAAIDFDARQNIFAENGTAHLFSRKQCDKMVYAEERNTLESHALTLVRRHRRISLRQTGKSPESRSSRPHLTGNALKAVSKERKRDESLSIKNHPAVRRNACVEKSRHTCGY